MVLLGAEEGDAEVIVWVALCVYVCACVCAEYCNLSTMLITVNGTEPGWLAALSLTEFHEAYEMHSGEKKNGKRTNSSVDKNVMCNQACSVKQNLEK